MPRAQKMMDESSRKVFYWEDTGAVEAILKNGQIVQAVSVEGVTAVSPDGTIENLPVHWEADE